MLDVDGVEVTYSGAIRALRGVNLHMGSGEMVAVLGSNGAGKTTLLRTISGTLRRRQGRIEAGRILLGGDDLTGMDAADIVGLGVVHVPEGRRVFGRLTVEENLRAGAMTVASRAQRAEARTRVFDLFPRLAERRGHRAVLLSGGEQQMLAIGRALMSNPRLLLLDEPSLGLAPQVTNRIGEILIEINRQGASIMLVEQNASMALRIAGTAYVLEVGRVSLSGPAAHLATSAEVARLYLAQGDTPAPDEPPAMDDTAGTTEAVHTPAPPTRTAGMPGAADTASTANTTSMPNTTNMAKSMHEADTATGTGTGTGR